MDKVMICLNPEEDHTAAVKSLKSLCKPAKQRILVAAVAEKLPFYMAWPSKENRIHFEKLLFEKAEEDVTKVAEELRAEGYTVTGHTLTGNFPECLLELASRTGVDLILKQPHLESDRHFELGKGDLKLMRESQIPVMMTREPLHSGKPALVAVAPVPGDKEQNAFCQTILQTAVNFCRTLGTELHIVHGWFVLADNLLQSRCTKEQYDEFVTTQESMHQETFDSVLEAVDFKGIKHQTHLVQGDHVGVIRDMAKKFDPQLLIIGSVGRSGVSAYLMGNTAETLVKLENRSVLLKKPGRTHLG